jgi:GAF domain-containing protein/HAMP domain-containing protein
VLTFFALGLGTNIIILTAFYFLYVNRLTTDLQTRLNNIASQAANNLDADAHAKIKSPADMQLPEYTKLQNYLAGVIKSDPELQFVYTFRENEKGEIVAITNQGRKVENGQTIIFVPTPVGYVYQQPSDLLKSSMAGLSQTVVEPKEYPDEYGWHLSAYAPIYTTDGKFDGIIGVDISATYLIDQRRSVLLACIAFLLISLPIMAFTGWLFGNQLARPFASISEAVKRIAGGDFSYRPSIKIDNAEAFQMMSGFNAMADQLQELITGLERRVTERTAELTERTHELEQTGTNLLRKAAQLEAISDVARSITSVQNPYVLLPRITRLISDRFGYYHVGIFLIDGNREYAVLRASNSQGGQRMLERGHRLKVGQVGIVGNVASTGTPRVALDVGDDAFYFNNPDLPETRSEIALPLQTGDLVVGVLDVQSKEAGAFQEEDMQILAILADQVSTAIQNAELFEETRRAMEQAQNLYRDYVQQSWSGVLPRLNVVGYRFSGADTTPIEELILTDEIREALSSRKLYIKTVGTSDAPMSVAVPLTLRGEVIGTLNIHATQEKPLDVDELDIVQAVAERATLALENARLFQETSRRAERERMVSEITSKIRSTNDPQEIIQTAVQELQRALGASRVKVVPQVITGQTESTQSPD